MKTPSAETIRYAVISAAAAAFVIPGLVLLQARAGEPPAPSASASAAPAASAEEKPKPVDPATLRSLEKVPPPETASAAPNPEEWNGAEPVGLLGLPTECTARILREWLQISCEIQSGSFAVISGSSEDVSATLIPQAFRTVADGFQIVPGTTVIQFPVRRGDRRLLQLNDVGERGYDAATAWTEMLFTLSEQWLDDQSGPWIAVSGESRRF